MRLNATAEATKLRSLAQIDAALVVAQQERSALISEQRSTIAQIASFASIDIDAILADRKRGIEIQLRDRQIAGLRAARDRLNNRNALAALNNSLENAVRRTAQFDRNASRAQQECRAATNRLSDFEKRWLVWITMQQYKRNEHANLERQKQAWCQREKAQTALASSARSAAKNIRKQRDAAAIAYRNSRSRIESGIGSVTKDIDERIEAERTTAAGSLRARAMLWARDIKLIAVLKKAAFALLLITLSPFLIRVFCYLVLAPLAMRRPAIRLRVPGGLGSAIPSSERSTTSVAVRLGPGEELLVRQDYLQTTSQTGAKGTQWFIDWRHPLTSFATGLTFLTRIRGNGEITTVSAVRDPFAEVTILTLPEGGACVLQPRALAAVVQPVSRRLLVTGHWRLSSLNAWLTMQLRYLIFHGPARLVIKGGRGVRIERAERGRVFGQEQLVGFSADLAYSVTRTETFWPYFLGREQLLKDRIEAGDGVLIIEEAPMAGRRAGDVKKGIEGMLDAGMKVFGM